MDPIVLTQATQTTRRAVNGSGPDVPRPGRERMAPASPERPRSAATRRRLALLRSGSAAPGKPARA